MFGRGREKAGLRPRFATIVSGRPQASNPAIMAPGDPGQQHGVLKKAGWYRQTLSTDRGQRGLRSAGLRGQTRFGWEMSRRYVNGGAIALGSTRSARRWAGDGDLAARDAAAPDTFKKGWRPVA